MASLQDFIKSSSHIADSEKFYAALMGQWARTPIEPTVTRRLGTSAPRPATRPTPPQRRVVTLEAGVRRYVKVLPKRIAANRDYEPRIAAGYAAEGDLLETMLVVEPSTERRIECYSVRINGPSDLVYDVPADETETVRYMLGCGAPNVDVQHRQAYIQTSAELVLYV